MTDSACRIIVKRTRGCAIQGTIYRPLNLTSRAVEDERAADLSSVGFRFRFRFRRAVYPAGTPLSPRSRSEATAREAHVDSDSDSVGPSTLSVPWPIHSFPAAVVRTRPRGRLTPIKVQIQIQIRWARPPFPYRSRCIPFSPQSSGSDRAGGACRFRFTLRFKFGRAVHPLRTGACTPLSRRNGMLTQIQIRIQIR